MAHPLKWWYFEGRDHDPSQYAQYLKNVFQKAETHSVLTVAVFASDLNCTVVTELKPSEFSLFIKSVIDMSLGFLLSNRMEDVQGQPGLHSEILCQKREKENEIFKSSLFLFLFPSSEELLSLPLFWANATPPHQGFSVVSSVFQCNLSDCWPTLYPSAGLSGSLAPQQPLCIFPLLTPKVATAQDFLFITLYIFYIKVIPLMNPNLHIWFVSDKGVR